MSQVEKEQKLRAKTYSYLIDDESEDKKAKDTKMCVIKRKLKFEKPYGLVGQVTTSHARDSQFKPFCGHWNF